MSRSVSEVLADAADLIEPEGRWLKHRISNAAQTCFCMQGAVCRAGYYDVRESQQALELLCSILPESTGDLNRIAQWNDAPERTQAEVVAKLREAAKLAEAAS